MQALQLDQQPEIPTIFQAMNTLCDQSSRLANVPGVVDGQAIAAAIQQQTQQLTQQITQQFQPQFQRMESRLVTPRPLNCYLGLFSTNRIKNRMINLETAAVNARMFAANSSAALVPLEAITTGNPIPNFPQTITDLHALNGTATPLPQRLP